MIEVLRTGALTTVQDLGRPGLGHLGVGACGAADTGSLRLANRLAGNPEGAAGLEVTFGGLAVRFLAPALVACAGAPCPLRVDGRPAPTHRRLTVPAGATLELDAPSTGVRTYLAVAGGVDVPPVLGSRSTDTMAGLGGAVLRPGDRLAVGPRPATAAPPAGAPDAPDVLAAVGEVLDVAPQPHHADDVRLRIVLGPRDDWFAPEALVRLTSAPFLVTADCDRVGMRLAGPALTRRVDAELKPEGMVAGALQVPPNGQPILFLADHPVTGGYPVVAVVVRADLPRAAQARPGTRLHFGRG